MAKLVLPDTENDVTPKPLFLNRRTIIKSAGAALLASAAPSILASQSAPSWLSQKISNTVFRGVTTDEAVTDQYDATRYNNFYEFGTGKDDPAKYADEFNPYPWQISVEGECDAPGVLSLEDLIVSKSLEERIYRLRCVEAWSMVIPWTGIELGSLLKRFKPNSRAKYVVFESVVREEELRGQRDRFSFIDWPYVEGLRIDEAMHSLSFLAVGMYGEPLPNQNGAPIRLLVPWKYGFKSSKSIVKIKFVESEPNTTWNLANPKEYGFYSNVNPNRPHPRWTQATERRITGQGKIERIPTQMFNGYDQVASLYEGMDLKKFY
ncbi:protein-methionine-sulfoxide reductase catalytic subunit MsrP [Reinekea marina]|uniref:Protein-methionine-sulfoxide reductase catalytic subunit MsrP n=1 Tax=Reinekea marina TaxID=1310421 RepID=A0ABV7WQP1_9GAMM|nr:protein-methionine-sulfoxide reductase catalytic subunit MsrP [Reinekea marina]MDN3648294.1 protein-methionine-sulfoxide reductase catalytic subunit MsrP [Reinekea marina]